MIHYLYVVTLFVSEIFMDKSIKYKINGSSPNLLPSVSLFTRYMSLKVSH